ncbi:MAG: hypothetical protein GXW85_10540 [Clostridia bacterium]|nr:hypothetical protein [Clostridia bacterium]
MDDKSKEGLNKLAELKEELSKALAANDLTGAAEISQDLADLLKLIPDELLNSEQKAQELDEALAQIEAKAAQLAAQGNTGAAQTLGNLTDNLLAQKEGLGKDVAPVVSKPDYYLLFKDFKGQDVKVYKPYLLIEEKIYVPVREVFEALGAKIFWKTEKNQVIIQDKYLLVEFELGSSILYLNDKKIELARDIEVIEGTTYLPLDILIKGYNLRADETGMPVVVLYRK